MFREVKNKKYGKDVLRFLEIEEVTNWKEIQQKAPNSRTE